MPTRFVKDVILDPIALALWAVVLVIFLVTVSHLAGPAKGWLNALAPSGELPVHAPAE